MSRFLRSHILNRLAGLSDEQIAFFCRHFKCEDAISFVTQPKADLSQIDGVLTAMDASARRVKMYEICYRVQARAGFKVKPLEFTLNYRRALEPGALYYGTAAMVESAERACVAVNSKHRVLGRIDAREIAPEGFFAAPPLPDTLPDDSTSRKRKPAST